MSFFGFDASLPQKPLEDDEDLAVYTWGEDSYDGLGDALDERGDDLNDETFGASEPVGRDFDFNSQQLPDNFPKQPIPTRDPHLPQHPPQPIAQPAIRQPYRPDIQAARPPPPESLESLWNPQSQHRPNPSVERAIAQSDQWANSGQQHVGGQPKFSPFDEQSRQHIPQSHAQPRVRTLQEIEAELRASQQPMQQQHRSPVPQSMAPHEHIAYQSQYSQPAPIRQIHQQQHRQEQPQYADNNNAQMAMGQLERMLQAQHLSEPQYREPSPAQMLAQMGRLPEQQQFQPPVHRPHPQYPRQPPPMDFMNGGNMHQANINHQLAGIPPEILAAAGFQGQGFPPGMIMPPIGDGLRQDMGIHHAPPPPLDPERQLALANEATRKIMEAEKAEAKRRRKAAKISRMSRYNDLMTQSDKDFITRIQVSQLVTQDPYSEDFYAQVYSSFVRSRMGPGVPTQKSVLRFAGGAGVGVGVPGHRGAGRRENAMARMQSQVERIIKNAQSRQKDQSHAAPASLQGALGKVSGRSYKAAPRQMLQVDANGAASSPNLASASVAVKSEEHRDRLTQAAGKLGREAMNVSEPGAVTRQPPLTRRQVQVAVERLYDSLLSIEQMNREAPPSEDEEARGRWEARQAELLDELWTRSMIMVPVETSDPHPFISILSLHKGKRLIPRIIRLLPEAKVTLLLVLFVACFYQLDVVRDAHILDEVQEQNSQRWKDMSAETDAALIILPSITAIMGTASLRLLTGLMNILLGTGIFAVLQIVKSQPGIALLTAFMSRVDHLKHGGEEVAGAEDWEKWDVAFDSLLQVLHGSITLLFPSRRLQSTVRAGYSVPNVDLADQIAWQFLAALAAIGSQPQQMALVAQVRDMILEVVQAVHSNWIPDPNEAALKLANVNILLNAIGLDHTMLLAS